MMLWNANTVNHGRILQRAYFPCITGLRHWTGFSCWLISLIKLSSVLWWSWVLLEFSCLSFLSAPSFSNYPSVSALCCCLSSPYFSRAPLSSFLPIHTFSLLPLSSVHFLPVFPVSLFSSLLLPLSSSKASSFNSVHGAELVIDWLVYSRCAGVRLWWSYKQTQLMIRDWVPIT